MTLEDLKKYNNMADDIIALRRTKKRLLEVINSKDKLESKLTFNAFLFELTPEDSKQISLVMLKKVERNLVELEEKFNSI